MTTSPNVGVAEDHRRFHLDEDLLPDRELYCDHAAYLNHGRCVARNAAGRWFAAVVSDRGVRAGNWLTLHVSDDDGCVQGSQFPDPLFLLGPGGRYGETHFGGGDVEQVALALDHDEQLHVIVECDGNLERFAVDASGADARATLADKANWSGPHMICENAQLGDALIGPDNRLIVYAVRDGDLVEVVDGETSPVAPQGIHPSVFIEDDGATHVAFERDRRVYYTRRPRKGAWIEPELAAHWCSSWPSLVVTGGRVLIVYQGEGKVELKRYPDLAVGLRPNGGSTVSYAIHDGTRWTQHDFLQSKQIMLKRKSTAGLGHADEIFHPCMEEFWRPSLTIDRHGMAWMFFVNTTRRHIYWARWHGQQFGTHHEARGAYDCLSRIMLLQKDAQKTDRIGYLTHATQRFYFDAIHVPGIDVKAPRRIVFLDNLEVDQTSNLEHRLGMWKKEPQPLLGHLVPGDFDDEQIMWAHVEKSGDGYEMHYMGWGLGDSPIRANSCPGRAFSKDGYHWKRRDPVDDSDLTLDGENVGAGYWRPIGMRDDDEPDPRKRYKGLFVDWRYAEAGRVQVRTYKVIASPDGRHWTTVPNLPGVVIGDIVTPLQFMRDDEDEDPNRRYKITLCAGSHCGRGMAVYTSPDLIHWSKVNYLRLDTDDVSAPLSVFPTGPVAVDPDAAENPHEEENHDAVIWREHGILMFHYDAFYFNNNQHTNKALAVSRDGRHYWRIKRGDFNMPHGACGDWDSGRDRSSKPVRVGDEWWMWFAAGPASDYNDPEGDANSYHARLRKHAGAPGDVQKFAELRPWRVGLAKLRVDGWGYMQLSRDETHGALTTLPFETSGGESVIVNGTHLGEGLTLELVDAEGNAVAGYAADDFKVDTTDGVDVAATWSKPQLPAGTHRLRATFTHPHAKLYAIAFAV